MLGLCLTTLLDVPILIIYFFIVSHVERKLSANNVGFIISFPIHTSDLFVLSYCAGKCSRGREVV